MENSNYVFVTVKEETKDYDSDEATNNIEVNVKSEVKLEQNDSFDPFLEHFMVKCNHSEIKREIIKHEQKSDVLEDLLNSSDCDNFNEYNEKVFEVHKDFKTEKIYDFQNDKEFSEIRDNDEKVDISDIAVQSSGQNDNNVKFENTTNNEEQRICVSTQSSNVQLAKEEKETEKSDFDSLLLTSEIQTCNICSYRTKFKTLLNIHLTTVHNKLNVINQKIISSCQFCDKVFTSKVQLEDHLLELHKQKIKNDLKNFITSEIYSCHLCTYQSTSQEVLKYHTNVNHESVRLKTTCRVCSTSFINKKSLDDHLKNQHKQEISRNIFKCIVCSYQTAHKSCFYRHVNTIHNEKKTTFNCQLCDKSFSVKASLDHHLLSQHKQEMKGDLKSLITSKIHKCTSCAYKTTYVSDLNRHVNSIHNEQRTKLKCQLCDNVYTSKGALNEHLLKKHIEEMKGDRKGLITCEIHKCDICSFQTTKKYVFTSHYNTRHNIKRKDKKK